MTRIVARASGVVALIALTGCGSAGVEWSQYEGSVTNDAARRSPAVARLTVAQSGDTAFAGYFVIKPPLARGTGEVWGWYPPDSVYFETISATGDTVTWRAGRATMTIERMEGRYEITGGPAAGEVGAWSATLTRGAALRTGGPNLGALRKPVSRLPWLVLLLGLAGSGIAFRWALRTDAHPVATPREMLPGEPHGVGGWMAWYLLGQAGAIVWTLVQIRSILAPFEDGTWELGTVIPTLQPVLVLETLWGIVQIAAPALGILLTFRLDPRAPRYWFVYICALFAYSIVELGGWAYLQSQIAQSFGQAVAEDASGEVSTDMRRTGRIVAWAPIWAAYWTVSKRVRFTFGRGALGAPAPYSTAALIPRTPARTPEPTGDPRPPTSPDSLLK